MMKEAAAAAETAKRSREEFERSRDQLMTQLGMREDPNLRAALDLFFTFGHAAGSSGETALQLKEVMEQQHTEFNRMHERNVKTDEENRAHNKAHLEAMAAQTEALTRMADALDAFMEEELEEEEEPAPQAPRRPR